MKPQISPRAQRMPASPIRKLMPLAEEAKRRGVRVLHLNIGQPDLETPEPMRARLAKIERTLAYTPSGGTPEDIESLVTYYHGNGIDLGPSQLIATTGGSEAILFAIFATCSDGDELLTVEPYFALAAGDTTLKLRGWDDKGERNLYGDGECHGHHRGGQGQHHELGHLDQRWDREQRHGDVEG